MDTVFFTASKLFWLLARPESWLVVLLVLASLATWRGRDRAAKRLLVASVAFVLIVGITPVSEALLRPLETRFSARPQILAPAGIIVLGGAEDAGATAATGLPEVNDAAERFLAGLTLARRFPDAQLVFSGGSGQLFGDRLSGADVAAQIFDDMGVLQQRVLLERRSRNTAENAAFTLALIEDREAGPWVLVTSAFHMPRALGSFCAAGWSGIIPYPVDFRAAASRGPSWDFAGRLYGLNVALKEWVGLAAYRLTGRTEHLIPTPC